MGAGVTTLWPAGEVMTVQGPVRSDALGLTSMHEHIMCDLSSYRTDEADALARVGSPDLAFDLFTEHDRRRLIRDPRSRHIRTGYHIELLDAGANISIDCFGHNWNIAPNDWVIESDIDRLTGLLALVEDGYASQIVLGTDVCFKMLTRRGGGLGYRHLTGTILPLLRRLGLQEKDINMMTVTTPAVLLARAQA